MSATNGSVAGPGKAGTRAETKRQHAQRLSREEVARVLREPPGPLVARLRPRHGAGMATPGDEVQTSFGDRLGVIVAAREPWRSNYGDRRQYVRVLGINGASYGGVAYSAGVVRLRPIKTKGDS